VCTVTVFLSLAEFPRNDDDDELYSTIGLLVRTAAADTPKPSSVSSTAGDWKEKKEGEDNEDDYGDRKVGVT